MAMKKASILAAAILLAVFLSPLGAQTKGALKLGVFADADSLPFMLCETENLFAAEGVDVQLVRFQSAVERDSAFQAGAVDGVVTDVLAVMLAVQGGFTVKITSLTDGRYGIAATPGSKAEKLADLAGKKIVLNIFPSIDTPTCATSVRKFNEKAAAKANTVVLCISKDLPFAAKRFCGAEGIENVITGSSFRDTAFEDAYGIKLTDSALAGLIARSVVVVDESGKVVYTELVPEIANEPDYDAALAKI